MCILRDVIGMQWLLEIMGEYTCLEGVLCQSMSINVFESGLFKCMGSINSKYSIILMGESHYSHWHTFGLIKIH